MAESAPNHDYAPQAVEHFLSLYGRGHETGYEQLLYYAALPLILTPELLHYLRHAFTPRTPWIAEADILLAEGLCRQYSSYEQYLMHAEVRAYLMDRAQEQPEFRLADAARMLLRYIYDLERSRPFKSRRELQTQAWSAMVYIDDQQRESVVEAIKDAFRSAGEQQPGGQSELIGEVELERLARITEMLAPELKKHQALVDYARVVRDLLKGGPEPAKAHEQTLGVDMPSPAQLTCRTSESTTPQLPSVQNIHGWPAERVRELQRQTAEAMNLSVVFRDRLKVGGKGPEMVVIPAGQFLMGSPKDEKGRYDDEQPHEVKLVRPFAIGKYAVTFDEYDWFVDDTGRDKPGDQNWGRGNRPVINVSWEDAVAYAKWLSGQTGKTYRLPTEAEWEYAARAGSSTAYCFGNDPGRLGEYAWYGDNSNDKTHPVGEKKPNAWGLYDVHGNVREWVMDWFDENYYAKSPVENPEGPAAGSNRVNRGGSWGFGARGCRSANRDDDQPGFRVRNLGFRLSRLL